MAWADADYVQEELTMYQHALDALTGNQGKRIRETWDEMKLKGKG